MARSLLQRWALALLRTRPSFTKASAPRLIRKQIQQLLDSSAAASWQDSAQRSIPLISSVVNPSPSLVLAAWAWQRLPVPSWLVLARLLPLILTPRSWTGLRNLVQRTLLIPPSCLAKATTPRQ